MLTDIQIAQSTKLKPITSVAESIGIKESDLELYGRYKAKISQEYIKIPGQQGWQVDTGYVYKPYTCRRRKTTITVGLGQAMNLIGRKPSLPQRAFSWPNHGNKGRSNGRRILPSVTHGRHNCILQAICTLYRCKQPACSSH